MLTCSWSGSTAPGAKRISAVIRPVLGSIIKVLTSQPGKRVGFHSMSAGLTRCECSSAKVCFGVTASMTILRVRGSNVVAAMIADCGGQPPASRLSCPAKAGHPVMMVWRLLDRPLSRAMTAEILLQLDPGLFDHGGELF